MKPKPRRKRGVKSPQPQSRPQNVSQSPREQEMVRVAEVPKRRDAATTGPVRKTPRRILGSRNMFGSTSANTSMSAGGNFYSPELSTDFLELPQSWAEKIAQYRFFYETDPFVGQAIDVHTELPMSKVRFAPARALNKNKQALAQKAWTFCERWGERVDLLQVMTEIVHHYHLLGEAPVFFEDDNPEPPRSLTHDTVRVQHPDGTVEVREEERADGDERLHKWLMKNYKGWTSVRVLPPEQVLVESFGFTSKKIVKLTADAKTVDIVKRAQQGEEAAISIVQSMPQGVVDSIIEGGDINLNTDPEQGAFVYIMARKKASYEPRGSSLLSRVMRVLVYRDKLRQSQTSISSRHMTPIRVISAEDASQPDLEELREQVDLALQDPDYSIIVNFQLEWNEMGSEGRLLDLNGEYDVTDRQMYAGLGVTESLLSGESAYSGDRINLEVINTRYMLLREQLQSFLEKWVLTPMCRRLGFVEEDEDGNEVVLFPRVSFTRLALRDNADTFDALFNLYQKGSVPVEVILELLNVDPYATDRALKEDAFTMRDPNMNELFRNVYGTDLADYLVNNTDIRAKVTEALGLKSEPAPPAEDEGGGRFASRRKHGVCASIQHRRV